MTTIRIEIKIAAPPSEVWTKISDVRDHGSWMMDAKAIRITSRTYEGVGTTFDCDTQLGPFRTIDRMTITEWIPEATMGVQHEGLVTGQGRFILKPDDRDYTHLAWEENLIFPRWMGGCLAGAIARPLLKAIWQRNLQRLQNLIESAPPDTGHLQRSD